MNGELRGGRRRRQHEAAVLHRMRFSRRITRISTVTLGRSTRQWVRGQLKGSAKAKVPWDGSVTCYSGWVDRGQCGNDRGVDSTVSLV